MSSAEIFTQHAIGINIMIVKLECFSEESQLQTLKDLSDWFYFNHFLVLLYAINGMSVPKVSFWIKYI